MLSSWSWCGNVVKLDSLWGYCNFFLSKYDVSISEKHFIFFIDDFRFPVSCTIISIYLFKCDALKNLILKYTVTVLIIFKYTVQ